MVTERREKEDNIVRSESLSIPLYDENSNEISFTVESSDPVTIDLKIGEQSGGCDMTNFIALCKRAIELWDDETNHKEEYVKEEKIE